MVFAKINCAADLSCPYQYYCQTSNNECIHEPVFPMYGYPIAIYCLFPFAAALCNTTGNSFGEFKVPFLMIALNYSEAAATILCYPMVAGTALFNFFQLIFRRHPTKATSLVDYNIVMIVVPSVLYGSTIGTLLNDILPPLIGTLLITILLAGFSIKFFMKLYELIEQDKKKEEEEKAKQVESTDQLQELEEVKKDNEKGPSIIQIRFMTNSSPNPSAVKGSALPENSIQSPNPDNFRAIELTVPPKDQISNGHSNKISNDDAKLVQGNSSQTGQKQSDQGGEKELAGQKGGEMVVVSSETANPFQSELEEKQKYEDGHHMWHVFVVLIIFGIFAFIFLLAQGKIVKFSNCSKWYALGMSGCTAFYLIGIFVMKKYINGVMENNRRIGFSYEYPLDTWRYFIIIILGAFFGGFNAGLFSKGNSTTIIFTLVYLGIEPIVASAIVGFQLVFSALVSVTQAYSKGQLKIEDIGFYFGLTFIVGGFFSFLVQLKLKNMDKNKVNKILVGIIGCLTCMSSVGLLVNLGVSFNMFGKDFMITPGNFCKS